MRSKIIHIVVSEKLEKFEFVRRGEYRVRVALKSPRTIGSRLEEIACWIH